MKEVEVANSAAVESCHKLLALLSQQQDPALLRSIASETGEACAKFRKVVSLLSNGGGSRGGHARGRFSRRRKPVGFLSQKGFLESTSNTPLGMLMSGSAATPSPSAGSAAQLRPQVSAPPPPPPRSLDLVSSSSKSAHQFGPPKMVQPLSVQFQFGATAHRYPFQQQQQNLQAQMFKRSNSGISLKFDSPSGGTGTISSPRSFMSSLSMDGSVASLDGKPPMRLMGGPAASDPLNVRQCAPKRRCMGRGEDGSGKCTTGGKCHCSKRRKL